MNERDATSNIANLARKEHRQRRLGEHAACASCGISDPPALTRQRRTMIERHHAAGRANDDDLTVILCRNCHAVATEGQRDTGADLSHGEDRHPFERFEAALRSLAAFLAQLARAMLTWADTLAAHMTAFDAELPQWRTIRP